MDESRIREAVAAWLDELVFEPEVGVAPAMMFRLTWEERDEAFRRLGEPVTPRDADGLPIIPGLREALEAHGATDVVVYDEGDDR